jgi:hypothetical protein
MANFTTEADVREKLQLTDMIQAPDSLLTRSIRDAHTQILRRIDPAAETEPPEDELILGETLLAGAHVLRSLAVGAAHRRKHITIGGNRIEPAERDTRLHGLADAIESQAWDVLEPCLLWQSRRSILRLSDTQPVMGE